MKAPIQVLAYAMPTRSGFEAMMLAEAGRKPLGPSPYSGTMAARRGVDDADRPDMAENYFPPKHRLGIDVSIAMLGTMFVTLVAAIHIILRWRDLH
jgi:hypothetical protein